MASGFGSLRRFNETFRELFQRAPSALRRKNSAKRIEKDVSLRLRYRPPYDWNCMLDFLRARAIPGVEIVDGDRYVRTVEIDGKMGSIEVIHLPGRESLAVSIRFPDLRLFPAIVARARRQFDLGADIETIDSHLSGDPALASLVAQRPGLQAGTVLKSRYELYSGSRSAWRRHGAWLANSPASTAALCRSRF
jgi:AraC family transcriptional regulator of adaptative response / DNA-3-methyladenine glycosylase II